MRARVTLRGRRAQRKQLGGSWAPVSADTTLFPGVTAPAPGGALQAVAASGWVVPQPSLSCGQAGGGTRLRRSRRRRSRGSKSAAARRSMRGGGVVDLLDGAGRFFVASAPPSLLQDAASAAQGVPPPSVPEPSVPAWTPAYAAAPGANGAAVTPMLAATYSSLARDTTPL